MHFHTASILVCVLVSFHFCLIFGFFGSSRRRYPFRSVKKNGIQSAAADDYEPSSTIRTVLQQIESNLIFPTDENLNHLFKKCLKIVKPYESSIEGGGMGLFATKNIKAGTIISLYPAHAIGLASELRPSTTFIALGPEDQSFFDSDTHSTNNYIHFLIGSRPFGGKNEANTLFQDETLCVDVNPNRSVSPPWLSHYINDGAIVQRNDEESVLKYYRDSNLAKNCVNIPFGPSPILATVTTKKVKKGEEFFTSYGCSYWIDSLFADEESTEMTDRIVADARDVRLRIFSGFLGNAVLY